MRYHNITTDDMKNGDGLRVVLWVSGCDHGCEGCHNMVTWNPDDGLVFDNEAVREIKNELAHDYISGLTLSGGDPLYPGNRIEILELVKDIKQEYPNKTIWLYTGYEFDEIKDLEILSYVDVVVDGPFVKDLKDNNLEWRGSSNQRVIRL